MKAFLSHSSKDKEFVRAVADNLTRRFSLIDEQSFETGEEFKKSIQDKLGESSVFVLFASKYSLESIWVKFEMDEAWYQRLKNNLSKSLVYLIDSSVETSDLPEWLRRALVRRFNSPQLIARDIRHHLDELLVERQTQFYGGRTSDTEVIEEALTPLGDQSPPHAFLISGLPGVGRRTLVRHTVPDLLQLKKFVEIRVGEGDTLNDICANIADKVEPYNTAKGLAELISKIMVLPENEAMKRISINLTSLVGAGEFPFFVDNGGFMDSEGRFLVHIQKLIDAIQVNPNIYASLISWRRPTSDIKNFPTIAIKALSSSDTKRLLKKLANHRGLTISSEQVNELAEFINGYPPAAYFVIQQSKDYGVELVLRDKSNLVRFTSTVFLRHLAKLGLTDLEKQILTLLSSYSPLPLQIITEMLAIETSKLDAILIRMIDLSLIIATEQGYYRIADPICDAAIKAFGYLGISENLKLAKMLVTYLEQEVESPQLELSKLLFKASSIAGDKEMASTAIHMANDLINLTETLYHQRRYEDAIQTGYIAIHERPNSITARSFLIRGLIQEENWPEAGLQIDELRKYAPHREVLYLKGFLERRRGDFKMAKEYYSQAKELGWTGSAINRELALCYFLLGEYDPAAKAIKEAIDLRGDDRYLVDLKAQIAIERRDQVTAKEALQTLEVIDEPAYYLHRLSCFERVFISPEKALITAQQAAGSVDRPPFEILTQVIICQIDSGLLPEARKSLAQLSKYFPRIRNDVRQSLICKLEIAAKNFSEALRVSQYINNKDSYIYKHLRLDALKGELATSALSDETRHQYESELIVLEEEIAKKTVLDIITTLVDVSQ